MKKWYKSKTLWTNVIALGAFLVQGIAGFEVNLELQAVVLSLVNLGLRIITKDEVEW